MGNPKPYGMGIPWETLLIHLFQRRDVLTMNLYRLSPKPYGQESRAAIGTQFGFKK